MALIDFKLMNLLLHVDDHAAAYTDMYFRAEPGSIVPAPAHGGELTATSRVDFLTYLNCLSACKWHSYAGLDTAWLHIELMGTGTLEIVGVAECAHESCVLQKHRFGSETGVSERPSPLVLDIELPLVGFDLLSFALAPDKGTRVSITSAYFYVRVDESRVNPVRLALSTTTFNNEQYIMPNIKLVRDAISAEGDPIASNFHMFVVDNGRTLDVDAISDDVVSVIPNPNVGGSGGFARGMMAATKDPGAFTHVLLMDDDVRILPESILRTFNLLSLAQGRYQTAFINGAMLSLEEPVRQFEDVAFVKERGIYARCKGDLRVDALSDLLVNERTSVEVPHAYGAWWYSCIPVSAIEDNGLPLPLFIRCDDVEFGVRNRPTYMTMSGICVWHASFEGRFRASVDCYQHVRNFLIAIAVDGVASERIFVKRIDRDVRQLLRDMDYISAERTLDGLADYLKGPDFIAHVDGSRLMKENGMKNEQMVPLADIDPVLLCSAGVTEEFVRARHVITSPGFLTKVARVFIPYDKHWLPDCLLKVKPGRMIKHGLIIVEGTSLRCRTLVCLEPTCRRAAVRTMDRERWRVIRRRHKELMRVYRAHASEVRDAYRDAMPWLTSRAFWEQYLSERAGE